MTKPDKRAQIEFRAVSSLRGYERNARTHSPEQVAQLAASIREFGFTNPVLVTPDGMIVAGHGRVAAAQEIGLVEVPTLVVGADWSPEKVRAYVLADNKLALNAGWDNEILRAELDELRGVNFEIGLIGFSEAELAAILAEKTQGLTDPDETPEPPAEPVTVLGDVWVLGRHKLRCGSSSDENMLGFWGVPDLVMTDPPYCSGGFQESGRATGSVGTSAAHKKIANDRLSSRGFGSLIKSSVFSIQAQFFYIFTDWRMWVYLFDVAEASSAGVRSMITWNKGTPGMGLGWRAQHELIMWACRKSPPYAKEFPGLGNVISLPRQKNELHTTQKPVELMLTLLQGAPFARVVAEPFCGSGTSMIACEMENRDCVACELDPAYVDVAVTRWQAFTGRDAVLEATGETFAETKAKRLAA